MAIRLAVGWLASLLCVSCAALDGIEDPTDRPADGGGDVTSDGTSPHDAPDDDRDAEEPRDAGISGDALDLDDGVTTPDAQGVDDAATCTPVAPRSWMCPSSSTSGTISVPGSFCYYDPNYPGEAFGASTPSNCECLETYNCTCLDQGTDSGVYTPRFSLACHGSCADTSNGPIVTCTD
jgi:hypothetical protein